MPESNIDLILRSRKEGDAPQQALDDLTQMKSGLSDVEKAMAGTRSTVGGLDRDINLLGTNVGSTADLLSGLGVSIPVSPMQLFGQAVMAAGQYVQDSISSYSSYVEEVDRIATFTGMATEETSRLIQVADDLRIGTGTLEMALKTMAQNGMTPSMQGIMQLSDQYRTIQDPLLQAQFLTENFGRAGIEMARIMELGSEEIKDMSDEVSRYMVVTGESREVAEAHMLAMDRWNDALDEGKYRLAAGVIPTITKLINGILDADEQMDKHVSKWWALVPGVNAAITAYHQIKNLISQFDGGKNKVDQITGAWNNATNAVNNYNRAASNTSRGSIYSRPNYGSIYDPPAPYGGGQADGGPVQPGMIYKVGEREVETLMVGAPGQVIPSSAGNSPIQFVYAPMMSMADEAEAQRVLLPYIREALRA